MDAEEQILKMSENKSLDLQKVCRICLNLNDESKYSLFECNGDSVTLYSKLILLTKLKNEPQEKCLPKFICKDCKQQLEEADKFRMKCEYSEAFLRKVLLKEPPLPHSDCIKKEECEDEKINIKTKCIRLMTDNILARSRINISKKKLTKELKKRHGTKITEQEALCDGGDVLEDIKKEMEDDSDFSEATQQSIIGTIMETEAANSLSSKTNCNDIVACKLCNKLLKSEHSLIKHIQKFHENNKKSSAFYKVEGYGRERVFQCTFCSYISKRKQGITGHIRTHTGEKPYSCDECQMHFPTSSALCNHKKVHSDQMNHTCPQCGKQFKMKSKYEIHKSVHSMEKNFQCHICNKLLKSKITLQTHLYRHDNIKNYSCEACGATFVTCSELISHSKSHGGEKKFKCTICIFMTQTKAALDAHLVRHSGERKYECLYCNSKHFTSAALRNHMIKHTKEKRYPCSFCEQKFAHSSSLNRHMSKAHETKCKWMDLVDRRIVK